MEAWSVLLPSKIPAMFSSYSSGPTVLVRLEAYPNCHPNHARLCRAKVDLRLKDFKSQSAQIFDVRRYKMMGLPDRHLEETPCSISRWALIIVRSMLE